MGRLVGSKNKKYAAKSAAKSSAGSQKIVVQTMTIEPYEKVSVSSRRNVSEITSRLMDRMTNCPEGSSFVISDKTINHGTLYSRAHTARTYVLENNPDLDIVITRCGENSFRVGNGRSIGAPRA